MLIRIDKTKLINSVEEILISFGVSKENAKAVSEVLVAADARGIKSHGIARLNLYLSGITDGSIVPNSEINILSQSPFCLVVDAQGGLGQAIGKQVMNTVISMAERQGVGIGTVRNSNHFGIAGYYAEMAAKHNMIGIAMTNTAALGVPTFSKEAMFGTNPIAFAAPGLDGKMFSLDMATTCIPRGKLEVYKRKNESIPTGWAVGKDGKNTNDPIAVLENMKTQEGGGLLPLGGDGEAFGGHKGYGLAILVDILTGILSGGRFGKDIVDGEISPARVSHFFCAIKIDAFRSEKDFKKDVSFFLNQLSHLDPIENHDQVYYAGQKEHEKEFESLRKGVGIETEVWKKFCEIAKTNNVRIPPIYEMED